MQVGYEQGIWQTIVSSEGFWEEATSQASHEGEDFVQQAIGLGRGLPEWEAWEACEPLVRPG